MVTFRATPQTRVISPGVLLIPGRPQLVVPAFKKIPRKSGAPAAHGPLLLSWLANRPFRSAPLKMKASSATVCSPARVAGNNTRLLRIVGHV